MLSLPTEEEEEEETSMRVFCSKYASRANTK